MDSLAWTQRGQVLNIQGTKCYVQWLTATQTAGVRWFPEAMLEHYVRFAKSLAKRSGAETMKMYDNVGNIVVEVKI